MKIHLTLVLIFLGSACAPSPNKPPTASTTPNPTQTQISLSQVNLESIMVVDGDLPEHLLPDIITNENAVGTAEELDRAVAIFTQYFLLEGEEGGGVSVFLFDSKDQVQPAFQKVSKFMDSPAPSNLVGEQALVENFFIPVVADVPPIQGSRLVFSRCHALTVIQFPLADDLQAIMRYGQQLDERIQLLVC